MKNQRTIRIFLFACITILIVIGLAACDVRRTYVSSETDILLKKTANPPTVTQAGDVITYTYVVTNNVNNNPSKIFYKIAVTSMAIEITDSPLDGAVSCPTTKLAEGQSVTCTATYTVTEADITNGSITNNASVKGTFNSSDSTAASACGFLSPIAMATIRTQIVIANASATVNVSAPAQSNVESPTAPPPANPEPQVPILTGDVPYCDLSSRAINLRLVDGFVPTDFNHKLTIGGEPMGCKVSEANSTILSCLYPPTTVFPASIQATLNGNVVNNFEFSGATCVVPDVADEDPSPPEPICDPIFISDGLCVPLP